MSRTVGYWLLIYGALVFGFMAFFGFDWSKDALAYQGMFDDLDLGSENVFPSSEILFWLILFIGKSAGLSLQTCVALLVALFVLFKLRILVWFGGAERIVVFVYLFMYFCLHDVTQIRIGCAAGFALLSCVYIENRRFFFAAISAVIGVAFHLSSIALPFVYFIGIALGRSYLLAAISLLVGLLLLFARVDTSEIIQIVLGQLDGRYLEYGSESFLDSQNSTGLAYAYAVFQGGLGVFFLHKGRVNKSPIVERMAFVVCIGSAFSLCFWNNVAVGVRIEELLGILLVPLISAEISSKLNIRSLSALVWISGVFLFGIFRFYYLFFY